MTIELRIDLKNEELETLTSLIEQQQTTDKNDDGYYLMDNLWIDIKDSGKTIIVEGRE